MTRKISLALFLTMSLVLVGALMPGKAVYEPFIHIYALPEDTQVTTEGSTTTYTIPTNFTSVGSAYLFNLTYEANYTYSWTFYSAYNYTATGDDIAVFIDGVYSGALGIAGPKLIPFYEGSHNITILAGMFGYGYSNTTVRAVILFNVTIYPPTVTVNETLASTVEGAPGFTVIAAASGMIGIAALVIIRRK